MDKPVMFFSPAEQNHFYAVDDPVITQALALYEVVQEASNKITSSSFEEAKTAFYACYFLNDATFNLMHKKSVIESTEKEDGAPPAPSSWNHFTKLLRAALRL